MKINFDKLKIERPTLYAKITQATGLKHTGEREFYPEALFFSSDLRKQVLEELEAWQAAPGTHERFCPCEACFNNHTSGLAREEAARLEVEKQNAPGRARLVEYIKQGLVDDLFNRNAFLTFIDEKFPGLQVIRPDHVDAFVASQKNALHWKAPEPAPVPEPAVRTLENGEPELPLDAGELLMHRASKEQLRDLSIRRGEGASHRKVQGTCAFQPMPAEITRKILVNCTREKLEQYRRTYGNGAIDARLQGIG